MTTKQILGTLAALAVASVMALWPAGNASATLVSAVLTPLPPTQQEAGKPLALAAKLTDTANKPLGGQKVLFLVRTDVFGERLMHLGYGVTDSTGRAAISYKPSWEGETKIVARFAGSADYAAAETAYTFNAAGPVPVHTNARFGLEPVRAWAPVAVIALVAAVWATLAFVVIHTVRGMRSPEPAIEVATSPRLAPVGDAGESQMQE